MVSVLEVAAGRAHEPQHAHKVGGRHPVAGLGVDGHWYVDAQCDPRARGEHLVARRTLVVFIAERLGHARARGRNHRKPSRDHGSGRGNVPRVR